VVSQPASNDRNQRGEQPCIGHRHADHCSRRRGQWHRNCVADLAAPLKAIAPRLARADGHVTRMASDGFSISIIAGDGPAD